MELESAIFSPILSLLLFYVQCQICRVKVITLSQGLGKVQKRIIKKGFARGRCKICDATNSFPLFPQFPHTLVIFCLFFGCRVACAVHRCY